MTNDNPALNEAVTQLMKAIDEAASAVKNVITLTLQSGPAAPPSWSHGTETAVEPLATPPAVEAPAEEPAPSKRTAKKAPAAEAAVPTLDEVRAAFMDVVEDFGNAGVIEVLEEFAVRKISDLVEAQFVKAIQAAKDYVQEDEE